MGTTGWTSQKPPRDPGFTRQIAKLVGPAIKRTRAEVRGLDAVPAAGGALVVSNHSGGMFTPDVLIFAPAFYEKFGFDRPVYTLAHYGVFIANIGDWLRRAGVIEASRENAAKALRSGAVVLVFPGGDYDSYRPTFTENVIDFAGRTGYVRTALETGVPIVPMVSPVVRKPNCSLPVGIPRQAAGAQAGARGDPADQHRVPVRPVRDIAAESAATRQDRHACSRADRRRCRVRGGPRRRRGRPSRAGCDAEGPR
jgi:hypothetical protein